MSFKGKSVLVTGAAGFIGSHLVSALFQAGCRDIILRNIYPSSDIYWPSLGENGPRFDLGNKRIRSSRITNQNYVDCGFSNQGMHDSKPHLIKGMWPVASKTKRVQTPPKKGLTGARPEFSSAKHLASIDKLLNTAFELMKQNRAIDKTAFEQLRQLRVRIRRARSSSASSDDNDAPPSGFLSEAAH